MNNCIAKQPAFPDYNQDLFCGAQAILWEMEELGAMPLPSIRTINRILSRNGLTNRRTGKYEAKGTAYPVLPSLLPNQTHQADLVGPCYLKGPVRFYSLNIVDTATVRCAVHPARSKSGQTILDGFWGAWKRMGIPERIQVDNAMTFFGSPTHPRGMGPLIRLCLHNGVEPWFIPMAEPWRNVLFTDRFAWSGLINPSEQDFENAVHHRFFRSHSKYRYTSRERESGPSAIARSGLVRGTPVPSPRAPSRRPPERGQ